jgi:hypothetical protein
MEKISKNPVILNNEKVSKPWKVKKMQELESATNMSQLLIVLMKSGK